MSNLLNVFSSVLKPKAPEFVEAKNLSFGQLSDGIIPVYVTVVLMNPNNLNVYLENASFDFYYGDVKIGHCNENPEMEVIANNKFELPVKVSLIAPALKQQLQNEFLNILTDGSVGVPLRIHGKAGIKKFGFSIDIPVDFVKNINLNLESLLQKIKI